MPNIKNGFHYTPIEITKELIKDIEFIDGETVLETCRGGGAFYDILPDNIIKDWCEIDMGRDFFEYNNKVDISIANPPYRIEIDGERKNAIIKWINHQFSITNKECWYLLNGKCWSSMTPIRLNKWKALGWNMCFMRILNIKKWYGRYYWVCFSKTKPSIIQF
jgi:hypothetical protein|tara:strand:+ start:107 stop:595 length:489 start_codon:yes stop_codon:yes gene_type:complete